MLERIISGGQTGVDRAALDVAMQSHFGFGGWCPSGHRAEDGPISRDYGLTETPSSDYDQRTEWNVRDADGVLIIVRGKPRGGTMLTKRIAAKLSRPLLIVNPTDLHDVERVLSWLQLQSIKVLDVAGPRESQEPGIYEETKIFLSALLSKLAQKQT